MCEPTFIAGAIGLATAGLGIAQSQQEAKYQNAVAAQTNAANAAAAASAYNIESAGQQAGVDETRVGVNQERTANLLKATQAQGSALAAGASSGVGGGALNAVIAEYGRQAGTANAEMGQSLRFAGQNAELQRRGTFERTVQETNLGQVRKAPKPGILGMASNVLGGVNTGLGIYSSIRS